MELTDVLFLFAFAIPMIGMAVILFLSLMLCEAHDNIGRGIKKYCQGLKKEFSIEEKDLLEKHIMKKFHNVEFSNFEYTVHQLTEIQGVREIKEKYIEVKMMATPKGKMFKHIKPLKIRFKMKSK